MPAKSSHTFEPWGRPTYYNHCEVSGPSSNEEVHIYLYNRICALEQQVKKMEAILRQQCETCQYKKVAENIKSILG